MQRNGYGTRTVNPWNAKKLSFRQYEVNNRNSKMYTKIILFVLACGIGKSVAQFRCYACGFSSLDTDTSCLTITNRTQVVECRQTYCTIMRQEFLDPPGTVASFSRSCEKAPAFLNHEVVDTTFRTFYRACTNDRCNIGDGIQSIVGGSLSPQPLFDGSNLLVPGTRNGVGAIQINLIINLLAMMMAYLLGRNH